MVPSGFVAAAAAGAGGGGNEADEARNLAARKAAASVMKECAATVAGACLRADSITPRDRNVSDTHNTTSTITSSRCAPSTAIAERA